MEITTGTISNSNLCCRFCGSDCITISVRACDIPLVHWKILNRFLAFLYADLVIHVARQLCVQCALCIELFYYFDFSLYESPFELNTPYCAFAVIFHMCCTTSAAFIEFVMVSLFIELALYAKAFIMDIKSMFARLDELAECKSLESTLLDWCKEAVEQHGRVYQ